jgi:prephenate dehydrogenase
MGVVSSWRPKDVKIRMKNVSLDPGLKTPRLRPKRLGWASPSHRASRTSAWIGSTGLAGSPIGTSQSGRHGGGMSGSRGEGRALEQQGTVAVIGVGLIGGSIGLALRSRKIASDVIGVGRDPATLDEAVRLGAIDRGTTQVREGVASADIVVVCTPVNRVAEDVRRAAEVAPAEVLVMDVGSTKRQIVETVERQTRTSSVFVGAHPIAGSERRGVANARAELFDTRPCVLTPTPRTQAERLGRAWKFWTAIGCRVLEMGPAEHDEILAYTSHLPHAIAAALASSVPADWLPLAAGAFRDGTRVAAADTGLWTAIFRENRGPLLKALDSLQDRLAHFKYALMTDDEEAIRRWWDQARHRRDVFDGQSHPPTASEPHRPGSH